MQVEKRTIAIQKSDASEFDARFVMSASTPDRVRDTIEPAAYDKAIAQAGDKLIALFNHNADAPIGYWTHMKRAGDALTGYIKFASVPIAQMVKTLIDEGVPMGASIGFRAKGEPNKVGGFNFKEIELMETSIVSTPAHPRAMQIAKQFRIDLPLADQQPLSILQRVTIKRAADAVTQANHLITRSKSC